MRPPHQFTDVMFAHGGIGPGETVDIVSTDEYDRALVLRCRDIEAVWSNYNGQEHVEVTRRHDAGPVDIILWTAFLRRMRDRYCRAVEHAPWEPSAFGTLT